MKKKLYVDLDDTYKNTEKYLRKILSSNGIYAPEKCSVYYMQGRVDLQPYFDMVFGNYADIPDIIGAYDNFKLLQTEYKIIFCSTYSTEEEANEKREFAKSMGKEIILCTGDNWDKSQIDMSDGILIDDNKDVLDKSNASIKIQMYNPYNFYGFARDSYLAVDWYNAFDLLMEVDVDEELRRCICKGIS